jgi:hypothetical protein
MTVKGQEKRSKWKIESKKAEDMHNTLWENVVAKKLQEWQILTHLSRKQISVHLQPSAYCLHILQ